MWEGSQAVNHHRQHKPEAEVKQFKNIFWTIVFRTVVYNLVDDFQGPPLQRLQFCDCGTVSSMVSHGTSIL